MAVSKNGNKKELTDWKRNSAATELINKLSSCLVITTHDLLVIPQGLPNELRGTYALNKRGYTIILILEHSPLLIRRCDITFGVKIPFFTFQPSQYSKKKAS